MPSGPHIALLNLAALSFLLVCLRYGIYRERHDVFVWTETYGATTGGCEPRSQFIFMNLENIVSRQVWNQLVAAGGCLLGAVAFVAFRLHARHIRDVARAALARRARIRREKLTSSHRVPRFISGPGSGPSLDGTGVLGIVVASLLASAAAISALGVNMRPFTASSPLPQRLTPELGQHYVVPVTDMAAIVHQSALIRTTHQVDQGDLTLLWGINGRPLRIGRVEYWDLRTRGVGLDAAHLKSAHPFNHMAPGGLVYQSIEGVTVGTDMRATCTDETKLWSWKVKPPRFEGLTTRHKIRTLSILHADAAELGVRTWLDDESALEGFDHPRLRQVFVLTRIDHDEAGRPTCAAGDDADDDREIRGAVQVIVCEYTGQDVRHRVRVALDGSSLVEHLEELGPAGNLSLPDMQPAALAINRVISHSNPARGDGGMLKAAMTQAGLEPHRSGPASEVVGLDISRLLSEILTDAAQGYFSAHRQQDSWWVMRGNRPTADGHSSGLALRAGGGGWLWVGVTASLALLPIVALYRMAAAWDRTGERALADITSDDGLSETEEQAVFIPRLTVGAGRRRGEPMRGGKGSTGDFRD